MLNKSPKLNKKVNKLPDTQPPSALHDLPFHKKHCLSNCPASAIMILVIDIGKYKNHFPNITYLNHKLYLKNACISL